jgi:hypothetical protein
VPARVGPIINEICQAFVPAALYLPRRCSGANWLTIDGKIGDQIISPNANINWLLQTASYVR